MKLSFAFLMPRRPRENPGRDWLILLSLWFVLFIASALWNAHFFRSIEHEATAESQKTATATTASAAVGQVENVISARAQEEQNYESGAYSFVDPSK